jgi:hypothetical protein
MTRADSDDAADPDFLALGLCATGLMAMLWSVAMGRRAVGVGAGDEASPGGMWGIPADAWHQLGLIDELMLERYGRDRLPRRGDGGLLRLADCLHAPGARQATSADEAIAGPRAQIAGVVSRFEYVDDRAAHTVSVTELDPAGPGAARGRGDDIADLLKESQPLHVRAAELVTLLRRYLEAIEAIDCDGGRPPRVRLFGHHRLAQHDGFSREPGDRRRVRIEPVAQAGAHAGDTIDLGIPELFVVTQRGDARRCGFADRVVEVDRHDSRGPVPARSDFAAGWVHAPTGAICRSRIATERDEDGDEYWVHQRMLAVEGDPAAAWCLVQVPTFVSFEPAAAVAAEPPSAISPREEDDAVGDERGAVCDLAALGGAAPDAARRAALRAFFVQHAGALVGTGDAVPAADPALIRVTERLGDDARVAANGIVAGVAVGCGRPLNDGEAIAGIVGHGARVLTYWRDRDAGSTAEQAIRSLADAVRRDTEAWIRIGAAERVEAPQGHFTADCFAEMQDAERRREPLLAPDTRFEPGPGSGEAVQTISPRDDGALRRWVYDNPALANRRDLLRWLEDTTPREEIAERLGMDLGTLLRSFNETAPLAEPIDFTYRGIPFSVVAMAGTCDDVAGERFPAFGDPVTLRCYLSDDTLLPQGMFEAADWNYMDAGRPGFVGYAYGVRYDRTLYLAGVQSDLGVRYSYLFQGRSDGTDVRSGDRVELREAGDLAARYGDCVPVLRRSFQRYWISIMLGAVAAWASGEPELTELGLLQFALEPEEDRKGHVVHRLYRELPDRLGWDTRRVALGDACHTYRVAMLATVVEHLGARWRLAAGTDPISQPEQGREGR